MIKFIVDAVDRQWLLLYHRILLLSTILNKPRVLQHLSCFYLLVQFLSEACHRIKRELIIPCTRGQLRVPIVPSRFKFISGARLRQNRVLFVHADDVGRLC